jgi:hypothetical protein
VSSCARRAKAELFRVTSKDRWLLGECPSGGLISSCNSAGGNQYPVKEADSNGL